MGTRRSHRSTHHKSRPLLIPPKRYLRFPFHGTDGACKGQVPYPPPHNAPSPISYPPSRPDGVWKRYVPNSLHYVCLRAWLAAGFDRSQFLLVKSERLRTMTAHELVGAVSPTPEIDPASLLDNPPHHTLSQHLLSRTSTHSVPLSRPCPRHTLRCRPLIYPPTPTTFLPRRSPG